VATQKFSLTPAFFEEMMRDRKLCRTRSVHMLGTGNIRTFFDICRLIEEALVCGSFSLVLKLTNNSMEIVKNSKRILYHTVSRRDQRNGV
jgi:hypothetical protein